MAGKTIVVFSDGTGNSSARLFKTNVWRTYQALDQEINPPNEMRRQIAYYDDGVGTSTFKPLAIIGGIFGYGLKRNVLDLYKFLCRNYRAGDEIYAFGFSRGAFTIRLLVGLITREGLLSGLTEEKLNKLAKLVYGAFRRKCFRGKKPARANRSILDRLRRRKDPELGHPMTTVKVKFVGVWDTVGAYGSPITEITRGIDKWIWPLEFTNYKLSDKVDKACHALALDDERDTFHPLIWDEEEETTERIQQVWFAGMHSDVGGGYPDDALAYVSLDWMMTEADGLRFKRKEVSDIKRTLSEIAPIHDSRRGMGAYYRYQPRKISALLKSADHTTLLMQDPRKGRRPVLKSVKIHESVIERIKSGPDDYAPIVLPEDYTVVGSGLSSAKEFEGVRLPVRTNKQKWVCNYVWKRRVIYFLTLLVSLTLVTFPLLQWVWEPGECVHGLCGLSDVILKVGEVLPLPDFLSIWFKAFAATPLSFLVAVVGLILLNSRTHALQTRINDRMRALWTGQGSALTLLEQDERSRKERRIFRLRTSFPYQRAFQILKWTALPNFFGLVLLIGLILFVTFLVQSLTSQIAEAYVLCRGATSTVGEKFATSAMCLEVPERVTQDERYKVRLKIGEEWWDGGVKASPTGIPAAEFPYLVGYLVAPFRRSLTSFWFQPLIKIVSDNGGYSILPLTMRKWGDGYTADFTAPRDGSVYLFVNDVILIPGLTQRLYSNNKGTAEVRIKRILSDCDVDEGPSVKIP